MKTIINLKLFLFLVLSLMFIPLSNAQVGVGTTTPAYTFHTINNGNIGATALGAFENDGIEGVGLSASNLGTTNGFNSLEGITYYLGTAFAPSGVFGLAISQSASVNSAPYGVYGFSNEWQGIGTYGGRFNSGGADFGFGGLFINDLGYTGGFFNLSDRKTKKDINVIDNALAIVNNLNPVSYHFDLDKYPNLGLNETLEYGFIAQEVKDVLPNLTKEKYLNINATTEKKSQSGIENTNELFLTLDYTRFIPILTKAIKEQQTIIDNQNTKIQDLEAKLLLLESKVNTLIENQD